MQHKQVKSELMLSTFCYTVEHIERHIDGKLFSIIERTTVYLVLLKHFYTGFAQA